MSSYDFSLAEYINSPLKNDFEFTFNSPKVVEFLKKLVSRWFDFSIIRWYHIKEIREILIDEEILDNFYINLEFKLSPRAYMKDNGMIFLSLGALLFRSSMTTLKVLCHELAHLWLSQQPFYQELKKLNKEFKEKYSSISYVYLMSPIELYAMTVSLSMMKEIEGSLVKKKHIKRWSRLIDDESLKIKKLNDLILTL